MTPHPKGGFCVFLDHLGDDVDAILAIFAANGWMPCF